MPKGKEANSFTPTELAGQIDLAATRFLRAFGLAGGSMQDLQGWVEHPLMLAQALEASRDWASRLVREMMLQAIGDQYRLRVTPVNSREVPVEIKPYLKSLQDRDFLTRNHTSDMVRVSVVTCKRHSHDYPCLLIYVRLSEKIVGHEGSHHIEVRCRYDARAYYRGSIQTAGCGKDQPLSEMISWWAEHIRRQRVHEWCILQ